MRDPDDEILTVTFYINYEGNNIVAVDSVSGTEAEGNELGEAVENLWKALHIDAEGFEN